MDLREVQGQDIFKLNMEDMKMEEYDWWKMLDIVQQYEEHP